MAEPILLGAHMSIQGGMHKAFERAELVNCNTMQVFTKQSNKWAGRDYTEVEIREFRSAAARTGIHPVVAHASYLINLCSPNEDTHTRSRLALRDELSRCEQLGILGLVLHPGAHLEIGEAEGIKEIAESLNVVHSQTPNVRALSILETTAGQGTTLGYRFEQLQAIIELVDETKRMAVCIDTCHVFAAGYNIGTAEGWERTMEEFNSVLGLDRLAVIHVNNSKKELGSRVDRHEHIGRGRIGLQGFESLICDPRLAHIPKILETEKSEDLHEDRENLNLLRSLYR